ncbi:MAG: hypothetical protein ACTSVI_14660 [Promethearchaeota archaeon]
MNFDDVKISCPNCKVSLPSDLKKELLRGNDVVCEVCGVLITHLSISDENTHPSEEKDHDEFEIGPESNSFSGKNRRKDNTKKNDDDHIIHSPGWRNQHDHAEHGQGGKMDDDIDWDIDGHDVPITNKYILNMVPSDKWVLIDHIIKNMGIKDRADARYLELKLKTLVKSKHIDKITRGGKSFYRKIEYTTRKKKNVFQTILGEKLHYWKTGRNKVEIENILQDMKTLERGIKKFNPIVKIILSLSLFAAFSIFISIILVTIDFFNISSFYLDLTKIPGLLNFFSNLYVFGMVSDRFIKRIYNQLNKGHFRYYGIDIIIIGIIGTCVFIVGFIIIILGVMVLIYCIARDNLNKKSKNMVIVDIIHGLDEVSSFLVLTVFPYIIIQFINGLLRSLAKNTFSLNVFSYNMVFFILFITIGIITYTLDEQKISPLIKQYNFKALDKRPLHVGLLGIFFAGSGALIFLKGILITKLLRLQDDVRRRILREKLNGSSKPTPSRFQDKRSPSSLRVKQNVISPEKFSEPEGQGTMNVQAYPRYPKKENAMFQERKQENNQEGMINEDAGYQQGVNDDYRDGRDAKTLEDVTPYLVRNFSVLTPKARKKLQDLEKLGLSPDEIKMVTEELVYRNERDQLEVLNEFIKINKSSGLDARLVLAVQKLNYPQKLKKWIIKQIRDLPDDVIEDFIKGLYNSQVNSLNKK